MFGRRQVRSAREPGTRLDPRGRAEGARVGYTPHMARRSLKDMLAEYGAVALVVYLTIFALVLSGFWIAIQAGFRPAGVDRQAGSLLAAYVLTKLTQPFRIAATLVLVPFVARGYERIRGARQPG
jgi:hypothetical protein